MHFHWPVEIEAIKKFLIPVVSCCLSAAYTTFFIMGLLMSMQVPFVGFQPIRTSEHMAAAGWLSVLKGNQNIFWKYVHLANCR